MIKCKYCDREYIFSREKRQGHTTLFCNSCAINRRRWAFKLKVLEYKGNKCQNCGYNKCPNALQFHHLDPSQKDFNISESYCRKWETVKIELDKCELICANCHAEKHFIPAPNDYLDSMKWPEPEHGSYAKYRKGCRCSECKLANNSRMRNYWQSRKFNASVARTAQALLS